MPKFDTYLQIRLTRQEKAEWQQKATAAGVSLSDFIRLAISQSPTPTKSDRSLKELPRSYYFDDFQRSLIQQIARIGNNLNQIARWANTYKTASEASQIVLGLHLIQTELTQLYKAVSRRKKSTHQQRSEQP